MNDFKKLTEDERWKRMMKKDWFRLATCGKVYSFADIYYEGTDPLYVKMMTSNKSADWRIPVPLFAAWILSRAKEELKKLGWTIYQSVGYDSYQIHERHHGHWECKDSLSEAILFAFDKAFPLPPKEVVHDPSVCDVDPPLSFEDRLSSIEDKLELLLKGELVK